MIMPFEKGNSGNKAGKPKGTVNKTTSSLRTWISEFINDNRSRIKEDWEKLDPEKRIILF